MRDAVIRPRALGPAHLARFVARHRARRGRDAPPKISMNRTAIHAIMFFVGMLACTTIAARRWQRAVYRVLPFAFTTAYAIGLAYAQAGSLWNVMSFVIGANLVAALLMAAFIVSGATRR